MTAFEARALLLSSTTVISANVMFGIVDIG